MVKRPCILPLPSAHLDPSRWTRQDFPSIREREGQQGWVETVIPSGRQVGRWGPWTRQRRDQLAEPSWRRRSKAPEL